MECRVSSSRASFIAIRRRQFKQPDVCIWHPAPSATRSVSRGSWACRWAQLPRTCDAPRTRTYSHLLPRPRSCAPHHVSGGATGGRVCRTSRCQCRRRLEVCDGRPHRLHVLWRARSCSTRALLTQPRCRSLTALTREVDRALYLERDAVKTKSQMIEF